MIPTNNEKFRLELIKRVKNSPYEYESAVSLTFKGRPANNYEKKIYRIQKGVNGNNDSVFIYSSNLPACINVGDRVKYLGQTMTVLSVGYYYDAALFVNAGVLTDEQIIKRCPKGINLQ